jgi:hypothetical protein
MNTENEQPNKPRGRPKKYLTEDERKEAQKQNIKKYFNSKEKDDLVFQNMRNSSKLYKQRKRQDPEYVETERLKYLEASSYAARAKTPSLICNSALPSRSSKYLEKTLHSSSFFKSIIFPKAHDQCLSASRL